MHACMLNRPQTPHCLQSSHWLWMVCEFARLSSGSSELSSKSSGSVTGCGSRGNRNLVNDRSHATWYSRCWRVHDRNSRGNWDRKAWACFPQVSSEPSGLQRKRPMPVKSDSRMEGGLCGLVERSPLTSCVWCQNSGGTGTVTETIHRPRGSVCSHIIWEPGEEILWVCCLS